MLTPARTVAMLARALKNRSDRDEYVERTGMRGGENFGGYDPVMTSASGDYPNASDSLRVKADPVGGPSKTGTIRRSGPPATSSNVTTSTEVPSMGDSAPVSSQSRILDPGRDREFSGMESYPIPQASSYSSSGTDRPPIQVKHPRQITLEADTAYGTPLTTQAHSMPVQVKQPSEIDLPSPDLNYGGPVRGITHGANTPSGVGSRSVSSASGALPAGNQMPTVKASRMSYKPPYAGMMGPQNPDTPQGPARPASSGATPRPFTGRQRNMMEVPTTSSPAGQYPQGGGSNPIEAPSSNNDGRRPANIVQSLSSAPTAQQMHKGVGTPQARQLDLGAIQAQRNRESSNWGVRNSQQRTDRANARRRRRG